MPGQVTILQKQINEIREQLQAAKNAKSADEAENDELYRQIGKLKLYHWQSMSVS